MNKRVGRLEFKTALEDSVRSQKGAIILLEVLELIHGNYSLLLLTILCNCSAHVHIVSWLSLIMAVLISNRHYCQNKTPPN